METLIVVRPFGQHRTGDAISEPDEAARVLGSEHAGHVVRCAPIGSAAADAGAHNETHDKMGEQ